MHANTTDISWYTGLYESNGLPVAHSLMKQTRERKNISQADVASMLGITRNMVSIMETQGKGLDNIVTRRRVALALGLSPLLFGLVDFASSEKAATYDITSLKDLFQFHHQTYLLGGDTGGLQKTNEIIKRLYTISESVQHSDPQLIELLCRYYFLGINIAREEKNLSIINSYATTGLKMAKSINSTMFMAIISFAYSGALYENQHKNAAAIAKKSLQYVGRKVHPTIEGNVITHAIRSLAHDPEIDALALADRAIKIAQVNHGDPYNMALTPGFALMWKGKLLIDQGNTKEGLSVLDVAEQKTEAHYLRRICIIRGIQADGYLQQGEYDQAAILANDALGIARSIKSQVNLDTVGSLYSRLTDSHASKSQDVLRLGIALQKI